MSGHEISFRALDQAGELAGPGLMAYFSMISCGDDSPEDIHELPQVSVLLATSDSGIYLPDLRFHALNTLLPSFNICKIHCIYKQQIYD
ncbi:hypothetical protein [Sporomusa termitida]|uniref:hypothetical protein n=1 Tax=Sporomusa termitida TaxID=2377 RepID=UPI0011851E1C|nr:hypothetical protein [Sporomusa termitida]